MSVRAFTNSLKELRIHFSQDAPASRGLRDFIVSSYPALKKDNPTLPILIRTASGVESRIIARFEQGRERKIVVDDMGPDAVAQKLKDLVSGK
ncbi:hypothetical protein GGF46_004230 [Coemansia sp. RSA 552]|nr:hypothetical protein GGF46_004230 [Coemansia sp. RSA 552]